MPMVSCLAPYTPKTTVAAEKRKHKIKNLRFWDQSMGLFVDQPHEFLVAALRRVLSQGRMSLAFAQLR